MCWSLISLASLDENLIAFSAANSGFDHGLQINLTEVILFYRTLHMIPFSTHVAGSWLQRKEFL